MKNSKNLPKKQIQVSDKHKKPISILSQPEQAFETLIEVTEEEAYLKMMGGCINGKCPIT